jgi:phosphoribosylglycinamide formyltransferase-1
MPIVELISGSGTNLQAIINAVQTGKLSVDIKAVISNRPDAKGLERARAANIPALPINHKDYADRASFDQALQQLIDQYSPKLVVLAGFMRILSEAFVNHYAARMLNIHPSLLPDFPGLHTHQRALDAGHQQHGATVHFVTNELDSGPAVIQSIMDIKPDDSASSLASRIHTQEHIIYPIAIGWFAEGRLVCKNNQAYLDDRLLTTPPRWINNELVI